MSKALQPRLLTICGTDLLQRIVQPSGSWRIAAGSAFLRSQRRNITIDQLNESKDNRERVVVLGSGWAGYTVARELNPKKYQVVVVSPRSYFVFTPLLASCSVGTLEFRTALEPVRSRRSVFQFFQGWADAVDFNRKTVTVEEAVADPRQGLALTGPGQESEAKGKKHEDKEIEVQKGQLFDLTYDKLIISVGCYSQTFGIPGVREHALFLKDVGDARMIRNRLLESFEKAALPTTSDALRKHLLRFAIVGGGPTGIEFAAELHDLIEEDMSRLYPDLVKYSSITVYDVAPKVLSMFDEKLSKYATETFAREGIAIKTSHHVQSLRRGLPESEQEKGAIKDGERCWTLTVKEEGEIGVGMVVWSTGLMMNPFVQAAIKAVRPLPGKDAIHENTRVESKAKEDWVIRKDPRSGGILTNDRLRLVLVPADTAGNISDAPQAVMQDVYAIGDCAVIENTMYPATAQVASQKAQWLAKRLNKGDIERDGFNYKNLGIMAYVGDWNAIMQSGGGGNISGRTAWFIWRGAYLTKAVSWRNKILIPTYWFLNWAFGRDISRF